MSLTLQANRRIYASILLMLVIAPLTSVAYLLFDRKEIVEGWYYTNLFFFLYVMGPKLSEVFILTGIFILFPADSRRAWVLVIPLGLTASKMLWLSTVSSNEEFHQVVPMFFVVAAALISIVWLFTFNWLMHRQFHQFDALCKRILLIKDATAVPAETRLALMEPEVEKLRDFHKQY